MDMRKENTKKHKDWSKENIPSNTSGFNMVLKAAFYKPVGQ